MPIFNRFFRDRTGKLSPGAFQQFGAFLNVEVAIPTALAEVLASQGETIPPPAEGLALIDTGASKTCVHEPVLTKLGVNPVGVLTAGTAAGQVPQSLYPARLNFPGEHMQADFGSVVGVDLSGQEVKGRPIIVLVGRDVLGLTMFIYNGPGGFFSIAT